MIFFFASVAHIRGRGGRIRRSEHLGHEDFLHRRSGDGASGGASACGALGGDFLQHCYFLDHPLPPIMRERKMSLQVKVMGECFPQMFSSPLYFPHCLFVRHPKIMPTIIKKEAKR
jgi:hypothetical protein